MREKKKLFLSRVESELTSVNIAPRVLTKFYELKTEDFLKIIKKMTASKISLSKLDEWENYFNSYKREIEELQEKIRSLDKIIDNKVYNLFNIKEKEIALIEETIQNIDKRNMSNTLE